VEPECRPGRLLAFEGEACRYHGLCEPAAQIAFQEVSIRPADSDIFRVLHHESLVPAGFQQLAGPQRKTAIPNHLSVRELRPNSSNIVIRKEVVGPSLWIDDEPVPLTDEDVTGPQMADQVAEDEKGIFLGGSKGRNALQSNSWVHFRRHLVRKQHAVTELD
jgi:hypothetical protein